MDVWEIVLALAMGVGLAAATGFRIFVPLLIMGIAARTGHLALAGNLDWLSSDIALVMLAVATALEIGGYYVPWVDNLLDTVATPAAAIAGTLAASSVFVGMDPVLQWSLGAIAGGGTALGVQALTVGARAVSTTATAGMGNPAVATAEAGAATGLALLTLFLPLLAVALVLAIVILLGRFVFRWRRGRRAAPPPPV